MKTTKLERGRLHGGKPVLITGGSGFIGANLAQRLLEEGQRVVLYDNLSRAGVEENYHWLSKIYGDAVSLRIGDTRDQRTLRRAVQEACAIYHFAAQVAVTTSLVDPAFDFEVNAQGTLNLLTALRELKAPPPLIFTSTNKVYGSLSQMALRTANERYEPLEPEVGLHGINENQPLDFYSPYGCSKGTADQYILDHARIFGLPAVVFRMSCIYGPHQFGTEDQGWIAHLLIAAREGQCLRVYGDGRQVRDALFVTDLVDALLRAWNQVGTLSGQAFNLGGGPANTTSVLELMAAISGLIGSPPRIKFGLWRPGDQRYYVSDTRKFANATGWQPTVPLPEGLRLLDQWLQEQPSAYAEPLLAGATRNGADPSFQ